MTKNILYNISLKCRQLGPALRALHLQSHPLHETAAVVFMLAWGLHNPMLEFQVVGVGLGLLGQALQAYCALLLKLIEEYCHFLLGGELVGVAEHGGQQKIGQHLLGPVDLLHPQQAELACHDQNTAETQHVVGLQLEYVVREALQVQLH